MGLKCNMGVLKADWGSYTVFDKTDHFPRERQRALFQEFWTLLKQSIQSTATKEIINEHREGEEQHVNSTH